MSEYFEIKDEDLIDVDGETPPNGWRPSQELLDRMNNAPALDLDLHMGGEKESREGEEWLARREYDRLYSFSNGLAIAWLLNHSDYFNSQKQAITSGAPKLADETWDDEVTLKSAELKEKYPSFSYKNYPATYGYLIAQTILLIAILVYLVLK